MFPGFTKLSGKQTGKFPGFKFSQKVVMMPQNPVLNRISQPCLRRPNRKEMWLDTGLKCSKS